MLFHRYKDQGAASVLFITAKQDVHP